MDDGPWRTGRGDVLQGPRKFGLAAAGRADQGERRSWTARVDSQAGHREFEHAADGRDGRLLSDHRGREQLRNSLR